MEAQEKPNIVMIDDNKSDCQILEAILAKSGLTLRQCFHDGLQGLNGCLVDPPDLLFLDLNLPTISGEDLLRMFRSSQRLRRLPIIIISKMEKKGQREMGLLRIGADYYFSKPFDQEKLIKATNKLLESGFVPGPDTNDSTSHQIGLEESTRRIDTHQFIKSSIDDLLEQTSEANLDQGVQSQEPARENGPIQLSAETDDFQGYQIMEMIGYGGMSTVYKAVQRSLGRVVALKVMMKNQRKAEKSVARFREEAKIMANLSHRNIVQIIDAGDTSLTMYIVLEYVPTGTLHDRLKRKGAIDKEELLSLSIQCCNAMQYLHTMGVIHRDLKPGNIFLSPDNTVKVGDFGISRIQKIGLSSEELENKRQVLGTPRFMAPEVMIGMEATKLSDQFSLGRTLMRAIAPHLKEPMVDELKESRKDLPADFFDILRQATEKSAGDRFADMLELKEALIQVLT